VKKKPIKKPIKKAVKKITKKKQRSMDRTSKKKKLSEWSLSVRARDGKKCVVCNREDFLNAHHILPKENYKEFMYDIMNGITLCPSHHKFSKYSAHKNQVWFAEFLRTYCKEQYKWAIANVGEHF
jgi:hypothetical protein